MITLPLNYTSEHWTVSGNQQQAKEAQVLIVSGLAAAAIVLVTYSLLSYFQVVNSINAIAQWSLLGAGGASVVAAALLSFFSPKELPSVSITSPEELKIHLEKLCREMVQGEDPLEAMQKIMESLPLDMLEKAVGSQGALQLARDMVVESEFYFNANETFSQTLQAKMKNLLYTLISIIDSTLAILGIADFCKPSESSFHADFKFQRIMMIISLFTLLTATLLPLLGVTSGASIVGGVMLLIALLSLIWPKIRPSLGELPRGENWSERVQKGKIWNPGMRAELVQEIYHYLRAHRHVMFIGPSGIGKTNLAQEITQGIEQGELPEFAGKKVIYFNMAELAASADIFSNENMILKRIEEAVGDRAEDYVLVFDEAHAAFADLTFGNKFKTFLDKMPYVLCMTTAEEYMKFIFIDQAAGDRRFVKLNVGSTTPEETEAIVSYDILRKAPATLMEEGALEHLIEQTKEFPQPLSALTFASQALMELNLPHYTPKMKELQQTKKERLLMGARGVVLGAASQTGDQKRFQTVEGSKKTIAQLDQEVALEEEKLHQLKKLKEELTAVRKTKYQTVRSIDQSGPSEVELNQLLLLKYLLEPKLEEAIKKISADMKVDSLFNREIIDKVIAAEKENQEKRKVAMEQAKKASEARQV